MSWNKNYNHSQREMNNHANQCNPNNSSYYRSRGYSTCNESSSSSDSDFGTAMASLVVGGVLLGIGALLSRDK